MYLSFSKSFDTREYGTEIGANGTPTCCAASARRPCSMSLPERITKGRSADNPRDNSAWPRVRTCVAASP